MKFSERMQQVELFAMWSACGVEDKGDGLLYERGTSKKAHGTYLAYYPKFMGMGTSNKVSTKLESSLDINKIYYPLITIG